MKHQLIMFLCGVGALMIMNASLADDYKDWVALLPKTLDGLALNPDSTGENMNEAGKPLSVLNYIYGGQRRTITLSIFSDLGEYNDKNYAETPESDNRMSVVKKITYDDFPALYTSDKANYRTTLNVFITHKGLVTLEVNPDVDMDKLFAIAKAVPIKAIAVTMKVKQ